MAHLAFVKTRVALYNTVEIEKLDYFANRHNFPVVFRIPAKHAQVVSDGFRQVVFLLVFLYQCSAVSFAHLSLSLAF